MKPPAVSMSAALYDRLDHTFDELETRNAPYSAGTCGTATCEPADTGAETSANRRADVSAAFCSHSATTQRLASVEAVVASRRLIRSACLLWLQRLCVIDGPYNHAHAFRATSYTQLHREKQRKRAHRPNES